MTYRTKQEAYDAGYEQGLFRGKMQGIKYEKARLKRKAIVNPLYNRPIDLKERVNREAEGFFSGTDEEFIQRLEERIQSLNKQPFSIIKWVKRYLP